MTGPGHLIPLLKPGPAWERLGRLRLPMMDRSGAISALETRLDPESQSAWSSYAHALARTDRIGECVEACDRALALGENPEVADLRQRVQAAQPRSLSERTAA